MQRQLTNNTGAWSAALATLALCCAGCPAGQGEGWIVGQLWVDNCQEGSAYGDGPSNLGDFDLQAGFFAGETLEDSNKASEQRQSRLTIRIQDTSNNLETSNGLVLQLNDLTAAARAYATGKPLPVSSRDLICTGSNCSTPPDPVRANLYLYAVCPQGKQPLVAASYKLQPDASVAGCYRASSQGAPPACRTLSSADRAFLNRLCDQGSFTDTTPQIHLRQILGPGACLYLCSLGAAHRGQNPKELAGFSMEYGDVVAGLVSLNLVDGRAVKLDTCARAAGSVQGMFTFEVTRGRAAQSFP